MRVCLGEGIGQTCGLWWALAADKAGGALGSGSPWASAAAVARCMSECLRQPAAAPPVLPSLSPPHLPLGGFAAASTLVRLLSTVVIPALAMLMVCCSMASWMAT